jgi:hypothetical protein
MAGCIDLGLIQEGHELWTDGWLVTIRNTPSRPKNESEVQPERPPLPKENASSNAKPSRKQRKQKPEPSDRTANPDNRGSGKKVPQSA